jgi:transposase
MLPKDHRVWDVLSVVAELDLTAFELAYRLDGQGRPPYGPRLMVGLLVYCYGKGILSGAAIAAACHDDLGCRIITGGRYPSASTVNDFVARHGGALKALLVQTLRMGYAEGLVDVSLVAGDGTYLEANAALGAGADKDRLGRQIADLQRQVDAADKVWQNLAAGRQGVIGDEDAGQEDAGQEDAGQEEGGREEGGREDGGREAGGSGLVDGRRAWERLTVLSRQLQRRQAALAQLDAHPGREWQDWSARQEMILQRVGRAEERLAAARSKQQAAIEVRREADAAGRRTSGTPPVPVEQYVRVRQARARLARAQQRAEEIAAQEPSMGKINTTDPDSAVMPGKRGGFRPRYNVQALCCRDQFVIAIRTHASSNDKQALQALLNQARANLDAAEITDPMQAALFDSGYASEANFTCALPVETLLVAVQQESRQTGRKTGPAATGRSGSTTSTTSTATASWEAMAERMREPANAALYKRRSATVEPLFAQLFTRFGRGLAYRTLDHVETEIHLWAVVHNLHKIMSRRKKSAPPG